MTVFKLWLSLSSGSFWNFSLTATSWSTVSSSFFFFLKILCIYFLERGEGKKKEKERNIMWLPLKRPLLGTWPTTQACSLTGNQTSDPLVCRPKLYPLSYTSQGCLIEFFRMGSGGQRVYVVTVQKQTEMLHEKPTGKEWVLLFQLLKQLSEPNEHQG